MLIAMVKAAKILLSKNYNVKLLFVGRGDAFSYLKEYVSNEKLQEHVLVHHSMPHFMIPLLLEVSDIVLAPYPININWYVQHPLKVVESLGLLKPVITSPLRELREIMPKELLIDTAKSERLPQEIAQKIEKILAIMREKDSKEYRVLFEELKKLQARFSWENIARKLYNCLYEMLKQ